MTLANDDTPRNPTSAEVLHVSVGSAASGAHFSFDWPIAKLGLRTVDGEVVSTDAEFLELLNFATTQAMRGALAKKTFDDRRRG
jgi:hypothetical protein